MPAKAGSSCRRAGALTLAPAPTCWQSLPKRSTKEPRSSWDIYDYKYVIQVKGASPLAGRNPVAMAVSARK